MGNYNQMGWAWFGATLGGYFGSQVGAFIIRNITHPITESIPPEAVGFVLGAFLGVLAGEALTEASVASGVKGMILGTKHALSASAGGYVGLLVARNVSMAQITVLPELTISAIGAAVGVTLAHLLLP